MDAPKSSPSHLQTPEPFRNTRHRDRLHWAPPSRSICGSLPHFLPFGARRRISIHQVQARIAGVCPRGEVADRLPLHPQNAIHAREGVDLRRLDAGRLGWSISPGGAAADRRVMPLRDRQDRLHADDTPVPVTPIAPELTLRPVLTPAFLLGAGTCSCNGRFTMRYQLQLGCRSLRRGSPSGVIQGIE
jgi:hypothetical protein